MSGIEREAREFIDAHTDAFAPLLRESNLAAWDAAGRGRRREERPRRYAPR